MDFRESGTSPLVQLVDGGELRTPYYHLAVSQSLTELSNWESDCDDNPFVAVSAK